MVGTAPAPGVGRPPVDGGGDPTAPTGPDAGAPARTGVAGPVSPWTTDPVVVGGWGDRAVSGSATRCGLDRWSTGKRGVPPVPVPAADGTGGVVRASALSPLGLA